MKLCQFDFPFAQWLAVRGAGILLVWCAVCDVAINDD
jgi:hypothetical protein